jgi:hypothetical protein
MKTIRIIAWISASVAALIIIFGAISLATGKSLFGFAHVVNFFHVANSFLLLAIVLFIASKQCCCNSDCECKEEKK